MNISYCVVSSLLFLAIAVNGQQVTVTSTKTAVITTTTTVVKPTFALCASLINATSACRRRRQYWIDTPVIIALDEDLDERLSQYFSKPSPVQQVEPTAVSMELRSSFANENDQVSVPSPSHFAVIQPSIFSSGYYASRVADPFFFNALANWINNLRRTQTVMVTTTVTSTSTSNLLFTTATKPFIIQGCVPGNLLFPVC